MSIVSVHGPNTFGSKSVVQNASGTVTATASNAANGLVWTFNARDQSQVAANYDWAYTPTTGTPASPINDTKSPTITFTSAGTYNVTLTLNGVAQPPITVTAVAGTAPKAFTDEGEPVQEEEPVPPNASASLTSTDGQVQPEAGHVEAGYDPAAHTVTEVIGFVEDNPDQLENILLAEEEGKSRSTLISHLESMRSS